MIKGSRSNEKTVQEADLPSVSSLAKRLWIHLSKRRRLQLGGLLCLMVIASLSEVVSIGAVIPFLGVLTSPDWLFAHSNAQPFIHFFGFTESGQLLRPLAVLFAGAAIFSGSVRLLLHWMQTRLGQAIGADFSISIYRRTLFQPYEAHLLRNTSAVIAGVTIKAEGLVNHLVLPLFVLISSAMMLATILLGLVVVQPTLTVGAFVIFGSIYALSIGLTRNQLSRDSELIASEQTLLIKSLQEALGGIRDVLIDGAQDFYCRLYENADRRLRRAQARVSITGISPRFVVEGLGLALIAGVAYSLSGHTQQFATAMPVMGALALGAQRMLPVLQMAYVNWTSIRGGQGNVRDALDLLEQRLPDHANLSMSVSLPFRTQICLHQIGFRYSGKESFVLRGLSLRIDKGSRVGFIGTTGSGKSTLLDLIMGLLTSTEGSLNVDGQAISSENCRSWQRHIAHVPQHIFLADASIAENIAFGVPLEKIDYERVRKAAQHARIAHTIETWEKQYNTAVGERGVRLSGGQRQRIGIARALYKQVDVLILDEATSALDNDTEREVMESIETYGENLTMLIVAHRLSTLKNCTHIVELDRGTIRRIGTYEEIIESKEISESTKAT